MDLPKFYYFTPQEIQKVTTPIESLNLYEMIRLKCLFSRLDSFRSKLRMKLNEPKAAVNLIDVNLLNHTEGSQHYLLNAADFWIGGLKKQLVLNNVVELLNQVGFKGIGVYLNEKGYYSFHSDNRRVTELWKGTKEKHEDDWTYSPLIEISKKG